MRLKLGTAGVTLGTAGAAIRTTGIAGAALLPAGGF